MSRVRTRPCLTCGTPTTGTSSYCPQHDQPRKARQRIYASRPWRGLRRRVLKDQPWCAEPGCNNLSTDVDHIVPLRVILAEGRDPYDRLNVEGLCKKHHGEKTRAEDWGRKAI